MSTTCTRRQKSHKTVLLPLLERLSSSKIIIFITTKPKREKLLVSFPIFPPFVDFTNQNSGNTPFTVVDSTTKLMLLKYFHSLLQLTLIQHKLEENSLENSNVSWTSACAGFLTGLVILSIHKETEKKLDKK